MATSSNIKGSFQDDTTHIYYNLSIYNNNTGFNASGQQISSLTATPANYNLARTNPYLYHPDEYDVTVVRMSLDNNSVPLQLVQPKLNKSYIVLPPVVSADGNTYNSEGIPTIYKIYIKNIASGVAINSPVLWVSEDTTLTPPALTDKSNMNSEYFYNYYVDSFLMRLNSKIAYMVGNLTVTPPASPNSQGNIPYFSFDNKRISFNAPINWMTDISGNNISPLIGTDRFIIEISESLYNLLDGLLAKELKTNLFDKAYQLLVMPNEGNTNIIPQYKNLNAVPLVQTGNYIKMTQEWSSIKLWNCVSSIYFKTAFLQIVNEMNAEPKVYGTDPNLIDLKPTKVVNGFTPNGDAIYVDLYPAQSNNADVSPIIFDFTINDRDEPETNFVPASEYRLTEILCTQPVSELNIETFWKDTFGQSHPLKLESGSSLSLKLLFRKKDFRIKR